MRAPIAVALALFTGCFSKPDRIDALDGSLPGTDAASVACTPMTCPNGMCKPDGFCVIMGAQTSAATSCPPGVKCRVECRKDKCDGGVRCGSASECDVHCDEGACKSGGVDCGTAGICTVDCEGVSACQGSSFPAVNCGASTCVVECDGDNACQRGVRSSGGTCSANCCGNSSTCQDAFQNCSMGAVCD